MIPRDRDTIAAIATPAGAGGVGVVRVSGPDAGQVLGAVLGRAAEGFPDRQLVYGAARDQAGQRLDDVLAVLMRAPRSFTGEDVAEIHGHGGTLNMSRLLRAVLAAGARPAEAGEFTRRAFEHGKIDLVRAEAIADVIEAGSERAWRLAQAQLAGGLGDHVSALRERATALLAEVEACIDFPEEGEAYLSAAEISARAATLSAEIEQLAASFQLGRAFREGIEVAFVGPVNAGKSSIFNALAERERAIVDPAPGTTRDFVELAVVWDGVPVTLIDTAGERAADDSAEQRGIAMGRERAREADLCVQVRSAEEYLRERGSGELGTSTAAGEQGTDADAARLLPIVSKIDLLDENQRAKLDDRWRGSAPMYTSAKTGAGINALRQAILARLCGARPAEADDGLVVTSERQRLLLTNAAAAFARASAGVDSAVETEILAIELREGAARLAETVGEEVGEEVLDDLFSRFCIGK